MSSLERDIPTDEEEDMSGRLADKGAGSINRELLSYRGRGWLAVKLDESNVLESKPLEGGWCVRSEFDAIE